ncbi:MAG: N-acetylmuramoyl-L-alanine amidase [Candidatus Omnitrophica bacterium]|nr:N-acetylmuramoyl-L-alanine amidase [Candidatus Omnitrophota bacterium]
MILLLPAIFTVIGCVGEGKIRLEPSLKSDLVIFGGNRYVPLIRVCDVYGLKCDWDRFTRRISIVSQGHSVKAMAGSDRIIADGVDRTLNRPILFYSGTAYLPVSLMGRDLFILGSSYNPVEDKPAYQVLAKEKEIKHAIKTIALDPGHGGHDIGAKGKRHMLHEKDMALSIAGKVRAILEKSGFNVIMTRDNDVFIPLPERTRMANDAGADLFVSIHINASRSKFLRGFECYYLSEAVDDNARALEALENSSLRLSDGAGVEHSAGLDKTLWDMTLTENRIESSELAGSITESVSGAVPINARGVKTARFYVLKNTNMPSVLVEVCYISNAIDEAKLKNQKFQDTMALAIANGILKYRSEFERTEGFTRI